METILITGINGYLGSHLAKRLVRDYNIIGLEYTTKDLFRLTEENFKIYSSIGGVDESVFTEQKIDVIIHTATWYGGKDEDYNISFNSNLSFPFQLLNKAIKYKCKLFLNTDTVFDRFVSSYSLTKKQFYDWLWFRRKQINVINVQLEHFYGPDGNETNFITSLIKRLKNNEPVIDLTPGDQKRDFIFIEDILSAFFIILDNRHLLNLNWNNFQVATGHLICIKDLVLKIKELTGSTSKLNFGALQYRDNELMESISDNSVLRKLGWNPQYTLIEGLKQVI